MSNSNVEGRRWGEIDPLFGVAAAKGRERGGASPRTDGEFYELGVRHWAAFHPTWQCYGLDYASCLEVGWSCAFEYVYHLRKIVGDIRARVLRPLIARGLARPLMRYLGYPAHYIFGALPALGLVDIEIVILAAERNVDLHPFVFARRAATA